MDIEWLGPYQIVGKLGRGGMGTVYEGVHRETGEPAAVKLLSAALAQEEGFRIRFEGEIETLRKLNHPNIVRLFGFGEQEGRLFYAMELVDGNSLEEELRRGRRFDWREVTRIGVEICRALRHAHDRGVIHRDIKPGNLLLATDGRVKLSDFGIARLFGNSRLTSVGNVVGTAEYMAPEQAAGQPVDARTDLYSLGALMYALLARRPVFRGKSLVELLQKQRFEQPEPLRKHAPDAPEELDRILGQLLEKDPNRRIPNADLLGRRLEAMLHALSVSAETAEADAGWFQQDEPSPASEATQPAPLPDDAPLAPTVDRPVGGLPVTPAPHPPTECLEKTDVIAPPQEQQPATATDAAVTRGHFIPVGEDELDPVAAEEPPPVISWQTGALAAALLGIGLSVWWFLQPPTADALYERIGVKVNGESEISPLEAEQAKNDIDEFLIRYPTDARTSQVREHERKIGPRELEWNFNHPNAGKTHTDGLSPIEQMYLEAIGHARLNPTEAMLRLQTLVDLYNEPADETGPTGQCLVLARHRLVQLRKEVEKQAAGQLALLRERLNAADAMRQREPERAQKTYRAVIELYGDKPWAAEAVGRAREAMEKNP